MPNAPQRFPENVEFVQDVEYGQGGGHGLFLDILRPKVLPRDPMPAVIWIHGGGWRAGDKANAPTLSLAAHGYFTASINYRLSGEAQFPAAVEDCKCAVRWLRANSRKYHVDPNRIGVWGGSAGGHLVEFLGTTADDPQFEGNSGWKGVSSRVSTVVSYFGPSDFTRGHRQFENATGKAPVAFLGGTMEEKPDVYRAASPLMHVSKTSASMLLVHGDHDLVVPLDQSTVIADALKKAGVEVQLIVVKNADHGFKSVEGQTISPTRAEIDHVVVEWFDKHLNVRRSHD